MLSALLDSTAPRRDPGAALDAASRCSSSRACSSTIALSRVGIRNFWAPQDRPPPRLRVDRDACRSPLLLAPALLMVVRAEPALRYLRGHGRERCIEPAHYIDAVRAARPVVRRCRRRRP